MIAAALGRGTAGPTRGMVAQTISHPKPVRSALQPTSILWGGRVFGGRKALARWLRSSRSELRRVALEASCRQRAARVPPPPTTTARAAAARSSRPRPRRATAAPQVQASSGRSLFGRIFLILIVVLAAVCASAAALPAALLHRFPAAARKIVPHRELLLTSAGALLVGLVIGLVLS